LQRKAIIMNKVHYSSKSNEWCTPKNVFLNLDEEFDFILDAAASKENTLCEQFFSKEDDALTKDWSEYGSVWCNPPYGRQVSKFIKKGFEESKKGATVVMLVPARVDTKWWHSYCAKAEVRFIKGRLKFARTGDTEDDPVPAAAPFPSAIVVFRQMQAPTTKYVTI